MRLSNESISNYLNKQKNMLPLVYCYSNNKRFKKIKDSINSYNGRVIKIEKNVCNIKNKNSSLLIFIDDIDEKDILDVEKTLISLIKDEAVILDITGIDSKGNKRNFVLSLLSRYNINTIKGTEEEMLYLIKEQESWIRKNNTNEDINHRIRSFAKNNNLALICSGKKYYITDGFSEFYIDNSIENLKEYNYFEDILSSLIAVGIAVSKTKSELIQASLISILVLISSRRLAIKVYIQEGKSLSIDKFLEEKIFMEYLVNEIKKNENENVELNKKIDYVFTR